MTFWKGMHLTRHEGLEPGSDRQKEEAGGVPEDQVLWKTIIGR